MKTRINLEATARFLQEELVAFVARHLKLVPLKTQVSPVSAQFL